MESQQQVSSAVTSFEQWKVFLIGYQRRFAGEFIRCKTYILGRIARGHYPSKVMNAACGMVTTSPFHCNCLFVCLQIKIESFDPVAALTPSDEATMRFVLSNSLCHDVDMLHWLFTPQVFEQCGIPNGSNFERKSIQKRDIRKTSKMPS